MQLRSRASEGKVALGAIRTIEESYAAEYDTYVATNMYPRVVANLNGVKDASWDITAPTGFDVLGYTPEGATYFSFQVTTGPAGCGVAANPCGVYTAEAASDIDDDNTINWWGIVKGRIGIASIGGNSCPDTGVFNPWTGANDQTGVVGPCASAMGQSIF